MKLICLLLNSFHRKYRGLLSLLFFILLLRIAANGQELSELPIHVFETKNSSKPFILYFTGDGGWNAFSKKLSDELVNKEYNVIVFDSREYFWNARTPGEFSVAVQKLISRYSSKWNMIDFAIVGYSFGADVASFLLNGLNSNSLKVLRPVVLLSPTTSTDFVVKISDLLGVANNANRKYKILPELLKSKVSVLCIFGDEEDIDLKDMIIETSILKKKTIKGSHRFNDNTSLLTSIITQAIELKDKK